MSAVWSLNAYGSFPRVTLCKKIRIPEPMNLSVLESGILGLGIRNPALGILQPANDWNPESRSLKIHCRWYYATKREAIDSHEGKII